MGANSPLSPEEQDRLELGGTEIHPVLTPSRNRNKSRGGSSLQQQVERVAQRAALAGKRKIWDSNDVSIEAAQKAVDGWEAAYNFLRHLMVVSAEQTRNVYRTTKTGAASMEHHLLVPVRDVLILPAFYNFERAATGTAQFFQSDQAAQLAGAGLHVVKQTPLVGETVLAPALLQSMELLKATWHVLQYPIPSRAAVRSTVDGALTITKGAILMAAEEVYFYTKLVDATVTRTLMHTQWRILGSGPYATLDTEHKKEVLDHLCERYFALDQAIARYELAAHIRAHNLYLYTDLVRTGLLLERGGNLTQNDTWLSDTPAYQLMESPFLLDTDNTTTTTTTTHASQHTKGVTTIVVPLWFRHIYRNGKKPGNDVPWVRFNEVDRQALEDGYTASLRRVVGDTMETRSSISQESLQHSYDGLVETLSEERSVEEDHPCPLVEESLSAENLSEFAVESPENQPCHSSFYDSLPHYGSSQSSQEAHIIDEALTVSEVDLLAASGIAPLHLQEDMLQENNSPCPSPPGNLADRVDPLREAATRYPTSAQWYEPNLACDVLVDQKRHAASYIACCPICRTKHKERHPPFSSRCLEEQYGRTCDECCVKTGLENTDDRFYPPPLVMAMRPTLWRYLGPGDDVQRCVWLVETRRHGLQPFGEEAAAVLEDAYLFLKWTKHTTRAIDGVLLTVQVQSPEVDEQQLVQFRSLSQVTAIQKTLGGALEVFKRRVYRGATIHVIDQNTTTFESTSEPTVETSEIPVLEVDTEIHEGQTFERVSPVSSIRKCDSVVSLAAPIPNSRGNDDVIDDSDNIDHLMLVVHGIGEMLQSSDLFGMPISSINECCDWLRKNHEKLQAMEAETKESSDDGLPTSSSGRVEYIPVEWHDALSLQVHRGPVSNRSEGVTIDDISLRTIPRLREFSNDTALDILHFMSPLHHDLIINIVTNEMNVVVEKFRHLTGFRGKVSLVAHSLGSIISWDILAHQKQSLSSELQGTETRNFSEAHSAPISEIQHPTCPELSSPLDNFVCRDPKLPGRECVDSVDSPTYPQLNFNVSNTFMLGSPVAVFLMIRNPEQPLSVDYHLPGCRRVFNIFHPYDPAAYRIEPLIHKKNANAEAKIIKHWRGGFRVKYQTKRLWRKLLDETRRRGNDAVNTVETNMSSLGLLDNSSDEATFEDETGETSSYSGESEDGRRIVHCGSLNEGNRIDYMLQEKEIENANEYVAALAAHSSYWYAKDLSLFIEGQISADRSENEGTPDVSSYPPSPTPSEMSYFP